jgi:hypothetical protein
MRTVYQVNYWNFTKDDDSDFHVFADSFDEAKDKAEEYLLGTLDEGDEWDFLSIAMLPGINIINSWEDESEVSPD